MNRTAWCVLATLCVASVVAVTPVVYRDLSDQLGVRLAKSALHREIVELRPRVEATHAKLYDHGLHIESGLDLESLHSRELIAARRQLFAAARRELVAFYELLDGQHRLRALLAEQGVSAPVVEQVVAGHQQDAQGIALRDFVAAILEWQELAETLLGALAEHHGQWSPGDDGTVCFAEGTEGRVRATIRRGLERLRHAAETVISAGDRVGVERERRDEEGR